MVYLTDVMDLCALIISMIFQGLQLFKIPLLQIAIISNGLVQSGKVIDFHAGLQVELSSGFEVQAGAVFHAYIHSSLQLVA